MYEEYIAVIEHLESAPPAIQVAVEEGLRKGLLLAAASYFEQRVTEILVEFARDSSSGNERLVEFVNRQALSRRYHTMFNWSGRNINQFWGLFGQSFRSSMAERVRGDAELDGGIRSFLELGNERNQLVHEDYGSFPLEKTSGQIYESYRSALRFIDALPALLRDSA